MRRTVVNRLATIREKLILCQNGATAYMDLLESSLTQGGPISAPTSNNDTKQMSLKY